MKKILTGLMFATFALYAKPSVTTTILPTSYFVKQIAGDTLEVNTMVDKGADPHTYEPKPAQMKKLEKSDAFFAIGIEFDEVWLEKFKKQFPNMKIINTENGIEKIAMAAHHHDEEEHEHAHHGHEDEDCGCKNDKKDNEEKCELYHEHSHGKAHKHEHKGEKVEHEHGHAHKHECNHKDEKCGCEEEDAHHDHEHHHGHAHHHDGLDPHVWTDPNLVKIQAKNILQALVELYPENKELYNTNYNNFIKALDDLDEYAKSKLSNLKNNKFIVYHPSWGYFAKRYNLVQIPIEIEGKEPKAKDLEELIEEAKEENIKVIFVAPQFSKKSAQTIAKQTGSKVIEIDQLPIDWDKEMRKTIDIFAENLK